MQKLCEGLDCPELNKKYGCSKGSKYQCLKILDRIVDAKAYADDRASGLNAFLHSRRIFGSEGRCHLWSRYFSDYLDQYATWDETKKGCLKIDRKVVFKLNETNRWQDHSVVIISNMITYETLILDDGFWGTCGDIYNPFNYTGDNLPPLLSEEGKENWNDRLRNIDYERKIRARDRKCLCPE
jgi:hypothetical protein